MSVDYAELNVTDRQRVLRLLSDCDWHPHYELKRVGGVRYGGRIRELKRLGYRIETRPHDGQPQGYDYRLVSTEPGMPEEKQVKVYLTEQAADALVSRRVVTGDAWYAVRDALKSFKANKGKL